MSILHPIVIGSAISNPRWWGSGVLQLHSLGHAALAKKLQNWVLLEDSRHRAGQINLTAETFAVSTRMTFMYSC